MDISKAALSKINYLTTQGKNKFNKDTAVSGFYMNEANGIPNAHSDYTLSDYIPVSPSTQYAITSNAVLKIAYFTAAKAYVSGATNPSIPITTPATAAYVRYSFLNAGLATQQFEQGSACTAYEAYSYYFDKDWINKNIALSYDPTEIIVDMQATSIKFYIKGGKRESNKYLRFQFLHETAPFDETGTIAKSNYDEWRLYEVYAVQRTGQYSFTNIYTDPIVDSGEIECALKEVGADDFMGGSTHGDEILVSAHVLFDGVQKTLGVSYGKFSCKSIKFVQKSQLYRVFTQTPVADHLKVYEITAEKGISLRQKLTWLVSLTLDGGSYLAMLPIKRKLADNTQITDHMHWNADYVVYDVSTPALVDSNALSTATAGVTSINIWGSTSGISAQVDIIKYPGVSTELAWISNSEDYNKLYFDICHTVDDYTTSINQVMETEVIYKMDIAI